MTLFPEHNDAILDPTYESTLQSVQNNLDWLKEQHIQHAIPLDAYVSETDKRVRMMMPENE